MKLISISLMLVFIYTLGMAVPPPDNSSPDRVTIKDKIVVSMYGIDDVGIVIVWNGDGAETVLMKEWNRGNGGSGSKNIERYLTKGVNYIMFILYNKVYQGGFFFAGGKWSYNFSIDKNDRSFWTKSATQRNNTAGVKYWKVIKANVNSSGTVSLSDNIPSDELSVLRRELTKIESKISNNVGIAKPF